MTKLLRITTTFALLCAVALSAQSQTPSDYPIIDQEKFQAYQERLKAKKAKAIELRAYRPRYQSPSYRPQFQHPLTMPNFYNFGARSRPAFYGMCQSRRSSYYRYYR